ncbi:3TM-type holin [Persicobacter diffluens]|uniref:Holin of 3TMs, for gene-transfer release n=1 Tax=Persicobacter diffluens TaxID=981 RepID=A0AAN5AMZ3_9BACT|nr:hypothetical protein PEDI_55110 [Persicobacter diffluens]
MGNFLSRIINSSASKVIASSAKIVDQVVTSDSERLRLKNQLGEILMKELTEMAEVQSRVILAEAQGGILQRNWRPVVMLSFAVIVIISAFYPVELHRIPEPFWNLLTVGIGGYVAGRTIEKVAGQFSANVDLSMIRKKHRHENINK